MLNKARAVDRATLQAAFAIDMTFTPVGFQEMNSKDQTTPEIIQIIENKR
jgi:hypothetical protein